MKTYRYYAREGAPFKKDHAQEIGEFINSVKRKTTENILSKIEKRPEHVIYNYLEWDDSAAGRKYRLQQIRNIINHVEVRIIDNGSSDPIRAFYSIVDGESNGSIKSYIQVDVAFNNDNARGQIIGRAKQELKNWRDRYKVYTELHDVVNVIEPFIS